MRQYSSWCVWRYEETEGSKPAKIPYSARTGRLASVTDDATWSSYSEAVAVATNTDLYNGIGFILSENDPYAFIDLDDPYQLNADGTYKHENPAEIMAREQRIYDAFETYAERSPSGKGLHLIVKGSVPNGRRRSAVEVYSNERYMTMTGNVFRNVPIVDMNEPLNALWEQMGQGKVAAAFYAGLEHAKHSDERIIEIASTAKNADKFHDLFVDGNWQKYYPSQSEADFALVDMLAFYSENRQQVQRLFLTSKLGQREKSRAQYRINYMLNRCFDRMVPPVDIEGLQNQIADAIAASKRKQQVSVETRPVIISASKEDAYVKPPGLLGSIAQFIYEAAPRPVAEIALAGAIGFMSGIVGRSYNVSGTGLNQYVLLLAPTGTGKEAIASGIDKMMAAVLRTVPSAIDFVGPAEISSAQALAKHLSRTAPSFVSVVGEFGIALSQMSSEHAPPHLLGLRRMMLDLYNKSGEGKVLRPTIYSDKEKNVPSIEAPAFTIMGESTPERFYESLHEGLITEGLLPRFTIIEYLGKRPPSNEHHQLVMPSFELTEQLATICAHSLNLNSQNKAIHVKLTPEAKEHFDNFDRFCDAQINTSDREVRRHLWNRAHVKGLKLAALASIGLDPYAPIIGVEAARWALNIVVADVHNLMMKFDAGEIGVVNDETKQIAKLIAIIRDYMLRPWSEIEGYKTGSVDLHANKIIPYSFLHKRLSTQSEFRNDRRGAATALKAAVKTLIERGDLSEVSRATLMASYKTHAQCYMIAIPRVFGL